jgi:hypothetical protein
VKVLVAYTEKTLRIVWTEAIGKCCICRVLVLTPGTETDDPSVFGELAHIVARNPGGPRTGGLEPDQLDSHGNLMLLCNKHHKQVDDQPNHFTVEKLHQINREHATWVASQNNDEQPTRLIPDPAYPAPKQLLIIANGNKLWPMVQECVATSYSFPDHLPADDEELVVGFLDMVRDYGDISQDLQSVREQRDAAKALGEYISQLAERRYFVGAYMRRYLLVGGVKKEPFPWPRLHIEIHPADQAHIVDKDGKSVGTTAGAVSREVGRLMFLRWLEEYGSEHPGEPAPVGKFFQDGRPSERQETMWRDLIRGLRNDELILCFESLEFWSSSSVLTDKGRAELEAHQP